ELDGNKLLLTGSDMETMIKVQVEVQQQEESANLTQICVPSKILLDYLKNLPEQPIHFTIRPDDHSIEISSSTGKYKIGGEPGNEYPKEAQADDLTTFQIPSIRLTEAINKTIFATSADNLRPAMTGVFLEFTGEGVTFVATDAHRLVKLTRTDISSPEEGGIIIPKKPLPQLRHILTADEQMLDISFNQTHLFISNDKVQLNCRLIEGKFPPYKAVI